MTNYNFTHDWFSCAPPVWSQLLELLPARRSFLEIGSYEGRSTVWTVEHMMEDNSEIFCIDTWAGGEEHVHEKMSEVKTRFDSNIELVQKQYPKRIVYPCAGTSVEWLAHMLQENLTFDFIYIDGSHIAKDVLTDACMSFALLKQGGIMVFDDYMWGHPRDALHRPKLAIDAFVNIYFEHVTIVAMGAQLAVQKH